MPRRGSPPELFQGVVDAWPDSDKGDGMNTVPDKPIGCDVLSVDRLDGVWTFTLNRPEKLNALNAALVDLLLRAVMHAEVERAKVMVFRGAGMGFCAGFDLSNLEEQSEGDLVLRFVRVEMLLQTVAATRAMTIALAHGKVFGAGVDLVTVCKQRIAAPETTFCMPGLKGSSRISVGANGHFGVVAAGSWR